MVGSWLKRSKCPSCGCRVSAGRVKSLLGQRFGRLLVVGYVGVVDGYAEWHCQCDCGNVHDVRGVLLRGGFVRSCGCLRDDMRQAGIIGKPLVDLTGRKFGRLTVLYRTDDKVSDSGRKYVRWVCECECGNVTTVLADSLSCGDTQSCGCLLPDILRNRNAIYRRKHGNRVCSVRDLTGVAFGDLTVMHQVDDYISPAGHRQAKWLCACKCGRTVNVVGSRLCSGEVVGCGGSICLDERFDHGDFCGRQFGMLTVIERVDDNVQPSGYHEARYRCLCECGRECVVARRHLTSGRTSSCGCYKYSFAEKFVNQYLQECGYSFVPQKKYDDLRNDAGRKLSYDFCVNVRDRVCLIECQGRQHYEPVERFGGMDRFLVQVRHDALKRAYADAHGFVLIEVPHTIRGYDAISTYLSDRFDSI